MSKIIPLIIFLVTISGYFFMNLFGIGSLLANMKTSYKIYISLASFLLIPVSGIILFTMNSLIARKIFNFSVYYSVFITFLFIVSIIMLIVKKIVPVNPTLTTIILIAIPLIIILISSINYQTININEFDITTNKNIENIKIVQLSDTHISADLNEKRIEKIVELTNEQNPDIVVITGDLLDRPTPISDEKIQVLNKIEAPIYFVFGNHDFYLTEKYVTEKLEKTKIEILRNEKIDLKHNITLYGIDDSESLSQVKNILNKTELKRNEDKFNILLYHRPYGVEDAKNNDINLMLSGHTHAGQIFPFNLLIHAMYKYPKGHKKLDENFTINTNSGTNLWGPKLRMFSKNEISVINIKK